VAKNNQTKSGTLAEDCRQLVVYDSKI